MVFVRKTQRSDLTLMNDIVMVLLLMMMMMDEFTYYKKNPSFNLTITYRNQKQSRMHGPVPTQPSRK